MGKCPKVVFYSSTLLSRKQESILLNFTYVRSGFGKCFEGGQPLTKQKKQNIHLYICGNSHKVQVLEKQDNSNL